MSWVERALTMVLVAVILVTIAGVGERLWRDIKCYRNAEGGFREVGDFIREDRGENFALLELVFEGHENIFWLRRMKTVLDRGRFRRRR